jgi:hypothetical protein
VIALVGLPARGKSFISRKLHCFLNWGGIKCKIFNVGRYRREAYAHIAQEGEVRASGACSANFFDAHNEKAANLRQKVAELALRDMLRWLDGEDEESSNNGDTDSNQTTRRSGSSSDRVAIFDATNSTEERRAWILEECTYAAKRAGKPTGVVFVESICDDEELLRQNYIFKVSNSPDYKGMNEEEAMSDLRNRVTKYEEQYETVTDDSQSYIKIFNLSSKLLVNHIYGRMAKVIVPAIMAWNVGTRPVFICRPGKTPHGVRIIDGEGDSEDRGLDASVHNNNRKWKAEKLGPAGIQFREALEEFMFAECTDFMRKILHPSQHNPGAPLHLGTSRTGLSSYKNEVGLDGKELPFPCTILASTMPRAADTVMWETSSFPVATNSNLNPIDKGDFAGLELEEILVDDPKWYAHLEADPYSTR